MKIWFSRGVNLIFTALLIFLLLKRVPDFYEHFKAEGSQTSEFQMPLTTGELFQWPNEKPFVIVFWATWCAPCELELFRINKLILNKQIKADSVLAISSESEKSLVTKVSKERNYQFLIGLDAQGQVANQFKVNATPTVVFINKDKKIHWMTTGLSPSLEFRVKNFLN